MGYTVSVKVQLSKTARKQLTKVPPQILRKFALWADLVRDEGLEAARAIPGYGDHALRGEWEGYRSVRLSQGLSSDLHCQGGQHPGNRFR